MFSSMKHRTDFCFHRRQVSWTNNLVLIYIFWVNRINGGKHYKIMSVSSWPCSAIKNKYRSNQNGRSTFHRFYVNWRFDIFKRFYLQQKRTMWNYNYYIHLCMSYKSSGQSYSSPALSAFDQWLVNVIISYTTIHMCAVILITIINNSLFANN